MSEDNQRNIPESVLRAYQDRFSSLKKGRILLEKNDFSKAITQYRQYLNSIARYKSVEEKKLSPAHFSKDKNGLSEMLLVSHVYWDLAKTYDRSANLKAELTRTLSQFLLFSEGFKYQHINARMMKHYMKKFKVNNQKEFEEIYNKLYVKPKGCYVATMCYGENHFYTQRLRVIRDNLATYCLGRVFIKTYYFFSPGLVNFLHRHRLLKLCSIALARPLIQLFILIFKRLVNNVDR